MWLGWNGKHWTVARKLVCFEGGQSFSLWTQPTCPSVPSPNLDFSFLPDRSKKDCNADRNCSYVQAPKLPLALALQIGVSLQVPVVLAVPIQKPLPLQEAPVQVNNNNNWCSPVTTILLITLSLITQLMHYRAGTVMLPHSLEADYKVLFYADGS